MSQTQKDHELWKHYKKDPSKPNWQALYREMKGTIHSAMAKNSRNSNLPEGVHFAEAVRNFDAAIKTWNPSSGSKLSSWVYERVFQKGKRVNTQHSNIGFIPESRYFKVQSFKSAIEELRDSLQREPNNNEIAELLGYSTKEVSKLQKEVRDDFSADDDFSVTSKKMDDGLRNAISYAYYEHSPQQKLVHEYMFASHGREQAKSTKEIADKTGIPIANVRAIQSKIKKRIYDIYKKNQR